MFVFLTFLHASRTFKLLADYKHYTNQNVACCKFSAFEICANAIQIRNKFAVRRTRVFDILFYSKQIVSYLFGNTKYKTIRLAYVARMWNFKCRASIIFQTKHLWKSTSYFRRWDGVWRRDFWNIICLFFYFCTDACLERIYIKL